MNNVITGWSVADITPRLPVALKGQFQERIACEVHSHLKATILVIQEEGQKITILISIDTCVLSRMLQDEICNRVEKLGLDELDTNNIVLMATHTHTAPHYNASNDLLFENHIGGYVSYDLDIMHPEEYFNFICTRIVEAIITAYNNREITTYANGLTYEGIGFSRLVLSTDGTASMYGGTSSENFDCILSVSDPGVELLYFWDKNDMLKGIIASVACPAQVIGAESKVSADYWGEARKVINKQLGFEVPLLSICSAAGDQSPHDLVRRRNDAWPQDGDAGCKDVGTRLANAIIRMIPTCYNSKTDSATVIHEKRILKLPMRTVSQEEYSIANEKYNNIIKEGGVYDPTGRKNKYYLEKWWQEYDAYHAAGVLGRWKQQKNGTNVDAEVHCIRIGNTIITTCPFELYIDYGFRIKGRVRALQVIPAQLACDCLVYLPTKKVVNHGGYGSHPANGLVSPEGGEILTETLINWANKIMDNE